MKIIISLRISIFILFFAVTTVVLGIASVYSLKQITEIQVSTASETMQAVGEKIRERTNLVYGRMESTLAAFERADGSNIPFDFDGNPWFGTFVNMMDIDKDIYSSYFGLSDGRFYQVIALGSFTAKGSKFDFPIPNDAAYAELRQFPDQSGKMVRHWTFYTVERKKISTIEQNSTDYNPVSRVWYRSAYYTSERILSNPYKFYMINDFGITLSSRLKNGMDGVFGTDVTVGGLSEFLQKEKITPNTRLLIYNENDMILGMAVKSGEDELYKSAKLPHLMTMYDIKDDAVAIYSANQDRKSEDTLIRFSSGTEKYLAKTIRLSDDHRGSEYVAIIIPQRDILGQIYSLHYKILLFVIILAVCSIPLISFASGRISRPIESIIDSMQRVKELDMTIRKFKPSTIKEINRLNSSISLMTEALNRYTRYVPKDTVKKIINAGLSTETGGNYGHLSIMSVAVTDFVSMRESMDAERLFINLSEFYSRIAAMVSASGGFPLSFRDGAIDSVWNAPSSVEDYEIRTVLTALGCSYLMNRSRIPFMTNDGRLMHAWIAVHCGEAAVGNTGTSDRLEYTASGRTLDIAESLRELNSRYGTYLLTTESIVSKLPEGIITRWLGTEILCGQSVEIFEIAGLTSDVYGGIECRRFSKTDVEYYAKFYTVKAHIERNETEKAKAVLSECIAQRPDDTAAAVMRKRLDG